MREPSSGRRRLCCVRSLSRFIGSLALALSVVFGVMPASAQSTVDVDVSTGLEGWLDSRSPFDLLITVSSDVLFDGTIQASMGSVVVGTSAQVPAGSTKLFSLTMPPPTSSGAIRVELLDGEGDQVETSRITPRYPIEEVLVGVGTGGPVDDIDRLRTPITDLDVVAVEVGGADALGVLDYYVGRDFGDREMRFVESGGVLVTEQAPPPEASIGRRIDVGGQPDDAAGAGRYRLGEGEIVVVRSISDVETYADLLIARERGSGPLEFWQSPDQGLSEAATNAGDGGVPDLPWLFGALIGYTILIGPVNFLVLRRMQRRDWAWLTIPAISVVALGVFWVVGGQRLADASVTHATVIVMGDDPVERTSVVLAVGREGSYTLGFDETDIVYPATLGNRFDEFGRPIATATGRVVGSEVEFDLQQLGFAGVNTIGSPEGVRLSAEWDRPGVGSVEVTNAGDFGFWAWGVFDRGTVTVSNEPLGAGASATLDLRGAGQREFFEPEFGFFLGDTVINQLGLFDDRSWRVISPLGNAAQNVMGSVSDRFVFGFSEDFQPSVRVDDRSVESDGNALVVVPLDDSVTTGGSRGGTLLAAGSGRVEPSGGPGFDFVSSDEMWLGYRLPMGVTSAVLELTEQFGPQGLGQQVWDWQSGTLVDVSADDVVSERFIDPVGNVVIRVGANRQQFEGGFVELPMSPQSYRLVWGDR